MMEPLLDNMLLQQLQLETLRIIEISGMGIALTIEIFMGFLAFFKMCRHSATGQELKFMFFASLFCASSFNSAYIARDVLYLMRSDPNQRCTWCWRAICVAQF